MKLDANALRYLDKDEWRVLTAVEIGQKSHSIVPTPLIECIAKLKHGGVYQKLCNCLKHKLVHHDASSYDGYRLTTLGYDFLAIHTLTKRGAICSVGRQIGVGKESDIFEVASDDGTIMALKLHRLGRTSFRAVKDKRDYLRRGNHYSWLYLSRLAAVKEYAFMKALGERGLPVPEAIDHNRHAVLMEKVDGTQLAQVRDLQDPAGAFDQMVEILCSMTRVGLVHCDFNEFNMLICEDGRLIAIDFPQMVSTSHANAKALFERDLNCIIRFFTQKLKYTLETDEVPRWEDLMQEIDASNTVDVELHASGFNNLEIEGTVEQHTGGDDVGSGSESDAGSACSSQSGQREAPKGAAQSAHYPGTQDRGHIGAVQSIESPQAVLRDASGPTSHAIDVQEGSDGDSPDEACCSGAQCPEAEEVEPEKGPEEDTGLHSSYVSAQVQTHNQEVRQAAMAKLQKGRKSQAQRQSRAKMTRNQSKSKGRKSKEYGNGLIPAAPTGASAAAADRVC